MKNLYALLIFFFLQFDFLIAQTTDSYYFNANSTNTVHFVKDGYYFYTAGGKLVKSDYEGNVTWSKSIPSVRALSVDEHSVYYYKYDGLLGRLDTAGNLLWVRNVKPALCSWDSLWVGGITANNDRIFLNSTFFHLPQLLVLDSSGNYINAWCDYHGNDLEPVNAFPSIRGGVWLQYVLDPGPGSDQTAIQTDSFGTIDTTAPSLLYNIALEDDILLDFIPTSDSGYIVADNGPDLNFATWNTIGVFKIDKNGQEIWHRTFRPQTDTIIGLYCAGIDSLNNTYLIISIGTNMGGNMGTMKLDPGGNILFSKIWSGFPQDIDFPQSYSRMQFHNGHLYCPAVCYNKMTLLVFDTIMSACGIADSSLSLSEFPYASTTGYWYLNTPAVYTPVNASDSAAAVSNPVRSNFCDLLGVDEEAAIPEPAVAPNPFIDKIKIADGLTGYDFLCILDARGALVYSQANLAQSGFIDLTFLNPGVYFLRLDKGNTFITKKLVKVKLEE